MDKTIDWQSVTDAKVLIIGENSTLQWSDEVIEHPMFFDYYFDHKPYDLGERSRYSEAKKLVDYITEISCGKYRPSSFYVTLLSYDFLERPPKGKHIFIPEKEASEGVKRIAQIVKDNPTIEYIFAIGMQTNYYLQKMGFYSSAELTESFLKGAEPRRTGINSSEPFYQPVNAKPFREVCYKSYTIAENSNIKVIPILPIKNYPLNDVDKAHFGANFKLLVESFI